MKQSADLLRRIPQSVAVAEFQEWWKGLVKELEEDIEDIESINYKSKYNPMPK